MKILKINSSIFFTSMRKHRMAIAVISYFILHASYLLSGCTYTIEGNPYIDLTEIHVSPVAATVATNGEINSHGIHTRIFEYIECNMVTPCRSEFDQWNGNAHSEWVERDFPRSGSPIFSQSDCNYNGHIQ